LTFQTRDIAASRRLPIRQLVFHQKRLSWMAFLRVQPRNVGAALAEGLWDLWEEGGITSAEGLRDPTYIHAETHVRAKRESMRASGRS
jgi:hypothetical protein